ncbi:hypothetical protein DDB_G0282225 [Dictyostelium discoideum AX4]|uniref:Uncharacterized protein n=1 Tax=Dictyostelium discoideum TaxID=44689 RepID=Q54SU0_DICDI|nr:hypothetical protein DDB_G0282225 [Dictyostelium discoideum AX4]EAL66318.1 hypothetical protein DDB_G0282225 [Dictyostelium discoideum AX4]|eukprot:XP_640295.1 hypothetical protein DDB_G0282225 [Dictyostelium discoideum AX4]
MEIDNLFFYCWRNVYIRGLIFNFIKTNKTELINPNFGIYNYYQMNDVNLMATNKGLKQLLVEKVEKKYHLNFNFSKSGIPFENIFKNFKNETDKEFFNNLFKNYPNYFLSSIDITAEYSMACDCVVAFQVLVNNFNYTPINCKQLFIDSILKGSIETSKLINEKFNPKLNQIDYDEIWKLLLNKNVDLVIEETIPNNDPIGKINKSIEYLVKELNAPLPPPIDNNSFKCFIDFSIKNRNLEYILSTCYSISYLKSSLELFISPFPNLTNSFKILTIKELDEIKMKLTRQELESNVQDIETNNEIISKLVGMASKFTIENVDLMELEPHQKGKSIIITGKESFKIFRSCKNNIENVFKIMVQDIIDNFTFRTKPLTEIHSVLDIIKFLATFGDTKLVLELFAEINKNYVIVSGYPNQAYSLVTSTEMFDIIFFKFKNAFRLNEIYDLVDSNNDRTNTYLILDHFKSKYPNEYNKVVAHYNPLPNHLLNEFIFNNLEEHKQKLIESECWLNRVRNGVVPLEHFKKLLEITPDDQEYHCFESSEIFNYVFNQRMHDIENGRFQLTQRSNLLNYYVTGKLETTILNYIEKPINFPNLNSCIDLLIKFNDLISLKFIFDYFNLPNCSNYQIFFKNHLILISEQNNLQVLSFIFQNYPTLLTQENLQFLFNHCYQKTASIEIINYIIKSIRFKPNLLNLYSIPIVKNYFNFSN